MNKFSIIIPVYNVEKYLRKCLNSVINQTYKDYEVIIVCDKSEDNSEKIVDEYIKKYKNFKKLFYKNTGLAKARNIGISVATGEYYLFLDSDDFYEEKLLEEIEKNLDDSIDLLRFQIQEIKNEKVIKYTENGIKAFSNIVKYHYVENSWCYCYKASFWKKNNFTFENGCIAEDFGLTPYIIFSASSVKSINYIGYNYLQRDNSLMNDKNYEKKIKKMNDLILQANKQKEKIKYKENNNEIISFLNDSLIYFSTTLNKKDYKHYNKILKKTGCFDYIQSKTLKQKIKKFILKNNSWFFYHYLVR